MSKLTEHDALVYVPRLRYNETGILLKIAGSVFRSMRKGVELVSTSSQFVARYQTIDPSIYAPLPTLHT